MVSDSGFHVSSVTVFQGFGDFKNLNRIDCLINKVIKNWGRYILLLGEKTDV